MAQKGKTHFTSLEVDRIKELINRKIKADPSEQKSIRNAIRKIGFYYSDYSDSKKGYTVDDFDYLIQSGQITINSKLESVISGRSDSLQSGKIHRNDFQKKPVNLSKILEQLLSEENFQNYDNLDPNKLSQTGFYCVKLKEKSSLPEKYDRILAKRAHRYIYIGKAEKQSLAGRLGQEIKHVSPGTFFRSIGAVLGYLPIQGHLVDKANQNNYKFSREDTSSIVEWLITNVEISIVNHSGDFEVEKYLIRDVKPLLNDAHNPLSLDELRIDKALCRAIARSHI